MTVQELPVGVSSSSPSAPTVSRYIGRRGLGLFGGEVGRRTTSRNVLGTLGT